MNPARCGAGKAVRARAAALATATATAFVVLAAVGGVGVAGCAHATGGPADVVRTFAERVARGEWQQAYRMMSDDYRARVPFEAFRRDMEAERQTVNADALALSGGEPGVVTAVVRLKGGERVALTFDGGAWKLDDQPLAPFSQHSPRSALRAFVRAVDLRRYDVLLRLVPLRQRAGVSEDSLRAYWEGPESAGRRRLLARLRENLAAPIVDLGAEAHMPYGQDGQPTDDEEAEGAGHQGQGTAPEAQTGEVRFVFEESVWRIEDAR